MTAIGRRASSLGTLPPACSSCARRAAMPLILKARTRLPTRWWRRIRICIPNCWRWCGTVWRRRRVEASLAVVKQLFVLAGYLVLTPACAAAQVTVNPAALQQLAGIVPPPAVVTSVAAPVHHWTHHAVPAPAKPAAPVQQATARVTTHVVQVPGPPPPAPKPAA